MRALLDGLIDYAGLFPPAALGMEDAVASYATYRRGPFAWMLGRFIVPAARLGEFEQAAASRAADRAAPARSPGVSACSAPAISPPMRRRSRRSTGRTKACAIDTLEMKFDPDAVVPRRAGVTLWFEVTPGPSLGAALWQIAAAGQGREAADRRRDAAT